jgi:hypothetical protein
VCSSDLTAELIAEAITAAGPGSGAGAAGDALLAPFRWDRSFLMAT